MTKSFYFRRTFFQALATSVASFKGKPWMAFKDMPEVDFLACAPRDYALFAAALARQFATGKCIDPSRELFEIATFAVMVDDRCDIPPAIRVVVQTICLVITQNFLLNKKNRGSGRTEALYHLVCRDRILSFGRLESKFDRDTAMLYREVRNMEEYRKQ